MKKIEFWLHRFVFVYGLVMLSTFFMCLLFNPTSELPVVRFFGRCILLTLVSMATLIVYASSEELTNRAWWFRHHPARGFPGSDTASTRPQLGLLVQCAGWCDLRLVYSGCEDSVASDRLRAELLHRHTAERTDPAEKAGRTQQGGRRKWLKRIGSTARNAAAKPAR